jgi:hypothetical protein
VMENAHEAAIAKAETQAEEEGVMSRWAIIYIIPIQKRVQLAEALTDPTSILSASSQVSLPGDVQAGSVSTSEGESK